MPCRIRAGERLVIASHNPGKVEEIEALLAPYGVIAIGAAALGLPEPEETGATFEANAELKARAAAEASSTRRLGTMSDTRASYHVRLKGLVRVGPVLSARCPNPR